MNEVEKVLLQCAECLVKYKKTLQWLENNHQMTCSYCQAELDVDQVTNEILLSDEQQKIYLIYQI